jgi:hypothetical protein
MRAAISDASLKFLVRLVLAVQCRLDKGKPSLSKGDAAHVRHKVRESKHSGGETSETHQLNQSLFQL